MLAGTGTVFALLAAIGSVAAKAQAGGAAAAAGPVAAAAPARMLSARNDILKRLNGNEDAVGAAAGRRGLARRQAGPSTVPEPEVNPLCIPPDLEGLSFQEQALTQHNFYRAQHDIPDLTWNPTIAGYAQELADTCVYEHSNAQGDGNYGQNIGAGWTPEQISDLIDAFMAERPDYPGPYGSDNIDISNFNAWGHYSQIVWTNTNSVGCAITLCTDGLEGFSAAPAYFTVCNYSPPGNINGQWSQVAAPVVDCTI